MNTHRKSLVGISLAAAALAVAFAMTVSCSDDPNLAPTTDGAVVPTEGGGADGSVDGGPDAGNDGCVSTEPRCNSCATAPVDPYNACGSAVTNCVPFDAKRIPQGPGGGIPQVL